jgi:4a-hydroxytetrahydrobiopterin dehydratase
MTSPTLHSRRCVPCTGDVARLTPPEVDALRAEVPHWHVEERRLVRRFRFPSFVAAVRFVDRMADVAEAEQHHPDFAVHYRDVDVSVWTHVVDGLTENDFILAAKIDALAA